MNRHAPTSTLIIAMVLATIPPPLLAADFAVLPSNGVSLRQIDFEGTSTINDTDLGVLEIDLNELRAKSGFKSGYLNASTSKGWIVKNLPMLPEETYPYSNISTEFDLDIESGTDVETLSISINLSDTIVDDYISIDDTTYIMGTETISFGGIPDTPVTSAPAPPNLTDILFGDQSQNDTVTQFDHPNIEAANNQCMPASVANSLQFLEDTTGLTVPHDNVAGLRGDNSLVGKLGEAMGRSVTSRTSGSGTWGLDGKLLYLTQNGLADRIQTVHYGVGAKSGANDVSATSGGVTASSTGGGTTIPFNSVLDALREGQDCEMVYSWPTGAHAVDLVAAGTTGGRPWIVHGSDLDQTTDSEGAGASGYRFEYLNDPDEDGQFNLSGGNKEIVQVICQKYIPPPPTATITGLDDSANHSCCVTPPPDDLIIETEGSAVNVTGTAPWLPMTGTITGGSFSASSIATVAGFSNVSNTFTGTTTATGHSGTLTLGANGELFNVPISYNLDLTNGGDTPVTTAVVRANGFRHQYRHAHGKLLRLGIGLTAADKEGQPGDWWMVYGGSDGFHYLDLATNDWQNGVAPSFTGPAASFPHIGLDTALGDLAQGNYTFYFGFDAVPDGQLNLESLSFDFVEVTIE